jgi:cytochrome c-type biogenesis protein CcmH
MSIDLWPELLIIALLAIAAFAGMMYPFRARFSRWHIVFFLIFLLTSTAAYWHWGGWTALRKYQWEQARQVQARALLANIKSPDELVEKLKARLAVDPSSARGWFLLGRIYASQAQWLAARDVFAKAYQLQPEDEATTVHYADSLWQVNGQHFNAHIREIFAALLTRHPGQPDALAMLATDAYQRHDYQQAVDYWQQLLKQVPPDSKEARALRRAIAKVSRQSST